jgi:hypothetical protein
MITVVFAEQGEIGKVERSCNLVGDGNNVLLQRRLDHESL